MNLVIRLWRELWENPRQAKFIKPLLAINFLGSIYGYYWYKQQLSETPVTAWLFVPDSPLATTFFTLMMVLALFGIHNNLLGVLAFSACIKYGLWAVTLITHYWIAGGEIRFEEAMLWVSHLGMALEGWIFLRTLRVTPGVTVGVALWMSVNDFVDYAFELHPYLFMPGQLAFAAASAMVLTLTLSLVLVSNTRRRIHLKRD